MALSHVAENLAGLRSTEKGVTWPSNDPTIPDTQEVAAFMAATQRYVSVYRDTLKAFDGCIAKVSSQCITRTVSRVRSKPRRASLNAVSR